MQLVDLIETPSELRLAIDARRRELGISMRALDDVAGLADGHASKLLGPSGVKNFGGMSLSSVLSALGLRLVLVSDDAAIPAVTRRAMEAIGSAGNTSPIRVPAAASVAREAA
jgi:hypothetical protein